MQLVNPYVFSSSPYTPESEAIFAAMATQPDTTRKGVIDTLVRALQTNGTWAKRDALYVLAAHAEQASLVNWISPGTFDATKVNSPTFSADNGWTGASGAYLDTGFDALNVGAPQMVQNSSHLSVAVMVDTNEANNLRYQAGNARARLQGRNSSGNFVGNAHASSADTMVAANSGVGLYGWSRAASANYYPYKNGAQQTLVTRTSTAQAAGNILICTSDGTNISAKQVGLVGFGSNLTSGEWSADYTAIQDYMTALGRSI